MDEHEWIDRGGIFYSQLFSFQNLDHPVWTSYLAFDQTKLPDSLKPTANIIYSARTFNIFFLAISTLTLGLISLTVLGLPASIITIFLFLTHPLVMSEGPTAKADFIFLTFLLLTIYVSSKMASINTIFKLGITSGLTAAAKLHGLIVIPIASLIVLMMKTQPFLPIKKRCLLMLLCLLTGILVFLVTNPQLWASPYSNTLLMIQLRTSQSTNFCQSYPSNCLHNLISKLNLLPKLFPSNIFLLLFLIGLVINFIQGFQQHRAFILSIWIITIFGFIYTQMFFYFDRYLLILIPFVILMQTQTLTFLYFNIYSLINSVVRIIIRKLWIEAKR